MYLGTVYLCKHILSPVLNTKIMIFKRSENKYVNIYMIKEIFSNFWQLKEDSEDYPSNIYMFARLPCCNVHMAICSVNHNFCCLWICVKIKLPAYCYISFPM